MKEEQLIQELRDGQDRAFSFLFREHFASTLHYITNNSGTREDAEDIGSFDRFGKNYGTRNI